MDASLIPLLLFTLSMTLTPGPNNFMLLSSSLNFGWRRSLPHYFGICFGFPLMVAVMGLGLAATLLKYPTVFLVVKVLCSAYLFWLAYRIAVAAPKDYQSSQQAVLKPFSFIQALAFQWINPKAWAMATSAFALFTTPEAAAYEWVKIPLLFWLVAFPCVGLWLWLGEVLSRWFQSASWQRRFNLTMAVLLVASVLPGIISG